MNPVPPGVFFPPYSVDSHLSVLVAVAVMALIIVLGTIVWSVLSWNREPVRLVCPARLRRVRAVFRLDRNGKRIDVLRCSVFGRRPITCGKVCLHTASSG